MRHSEAFQKMAIEKYLLGEMAGLELDEFEEHMFECAECAESMKAGAAFTENARAVFHEHPNLSRAPAAGHKLEAAYASPRERTNTKPPFWKWFRFPQMAACAAAIGLVCLAVYQRVEIARLQAPHATAIYLASAPRGAGTGVVIPNGVPSFVIEIDSLSPKCLGGCAARVLDSKGRLGPSMNLILTAERNAFISLTRADLSPGGYSVVVQRVVQAKGPDGEEIERYPFRVE